MLKNKCFLVLAALLLFGSPESGKSQNNNIAINLNEISVGNNSYPDNYGTHDAVEIYNAHTASVSLQSYYLSNDRNNLYKWQFPTTFTMTSGGYAMVYLSGIKQKLLRSPTVYIIVYNSNTILFRGSGWYNTFKFGNIEIFVIYPCHSMWFLLFFNIITRTNTKH